MSLRLAIVGVALIASGMLNLGGLRAITTTVGAVALAAAGIVWIATRRKSS